MAIVRPDETVDTLIGPIVDVVVMHKMLLGRARVVVGGATYISPVASTLKNLRDTLAHIGRSDRESIIVALAISKGMAPLEFII